MVALLGVILEQPMTLIVEFMPLADLHEYLKKMKQHADSRDPVLLHSYCLQVGG